MRAVHHSARWWRWLLGLLTLLRSRAIETGCFVLAPAQSGVHERGRETYGHSLVVNPWGEIICDGLSETGVLTAALDLDEVSKARAKVPSLSGDRDIDNLSFEQFECEN